MNIEVLIELSSVLLPIIFILVILVFFLQIFRRKSMGSNNVGFESELEETFDKLERRVAEIRSGLDQTPTPNRWPDSITDQKLNSESFNVEENTDDGKQFSFAKTTPTDNVPTNFVQKDNKIENPLDDLVFSQASLTDINERYSKPRFARKTLSSQFRSRDGLRQAVLAREILGPPKAFSGLH